MKATLTIQSPFPNKIRSHLQGCTPLFYHSFTYYPHRGGQETPLALQNVIPVPESLKDLPYDSFGKRWQEIVYGGVIENVISRQIQDRLFYYLNIDKIPYRLFILLKYLHPQSIERIEFDGNIAEDLDYYIDITDRRVHIRGLVKDFTRNFEESLERVKKSILQEVVSEENPLALRGALSDTLKFLFPNDEDVCKYYQALHHHQIKLKEDRYTLHGTHRFINRYYNFRNNRHVELYRFDSDREPTILKLKFHQELYINQGVTPVFEMPFMETFNSNNHIPFEDMTELINYLQDPYRDHDDLLETHLIVYVPWKLEKPFHLIPLEFFDSLDNIELETYQLIIDGETYTGTVDSLITQLGRKYRYNRLFDKHSRYEGNPAVLVNYVKQYHKNITIKPERIE